MCPCDVTMGVAALAAAMAEGRSTQELSLLGAVLVQLGDTLATLAAQRALCETKKS